MSHDIKHERMDTYRLDDGTPENPNQTYGNLSVHAHDDGSVDITTEHDRFYLSSKAMARALIHLLERAMSEEDGEVKALKEEVVEQARFLSNKYSDPNTVPRHNPFLALRRDIERLEEVESKSGQSPEGASDWRRQAPEYYVWNINRGPPRVPHPTYEEAYEEAERLSQKEPSDPICVLALAATVCETSRQQGETEESSEPDPIQYVRPTYREGIPDGIIIEWSSQRWDLVTEFGSVASYWTNPPVLDYPEIEPSEVRKMMGDEVFVRAHGIEPYPREDGYQIAVNGCEIGLGRFATGYTWLSDVGRFWLSNPVSFGAMWEAAADVIEAEGVPCRESDITLRGKDEEKAK